MQLCKCTISSAVHTAACLNAGSPSEGLANTSSVAPGTGGDGEDASAGEGEQLPWAYTSDDSISFPVDCVLQGDLLVSGLDISRCK